MHNLLNVVLYDAEAAKNVTNIATNCFQKPLTFKGELTIYELT